MRGSEVSCERSELSSVRSQVRIERAETCSSSPQPIPSFHPNCHVKSALQNSCTALRLSLCDLELEERSCSSTDTIVESHSGHLHVCSVMELRIFFICRCADVLYQRRLVDLSRYSCTITVFIHIHGLNQCFSTGYIGAHWGCFFFYLSWGPEGLWP